MNYAMIVHVSFASSWAWPPNSFQKQRFDLGCGVRWVWSGPDIISDAEGPSKQDLEAKTVVLPVTMTS